MTFLILSIIVISIIGTFSHFTYDISNHNKKIDSTRSQKYINNRSLGETINMSIKKDTSKVYRNGAVSVVTIDDIVVGDKVLLQAGDKVPADGVLVDGSI